VSWAHPTTGVVDDCAPSTTPEVFALIPGLEAFLDAGYVVAATDYEGLGTAGVHPYLVGESEGRGVLDAARAARDLPEAGAGDQLLLWGHSQGGQGSLFAGQLAPSYAPDLTLVATAAAAPAGELQALLNDDADTPDGVVLGAYAVNAYLEIFGPDNPSMSASQVVTPEGEPAIDQIVPLCNLNQEAQLAPIAAPLVGKFFVDDPGSVEPWQNLLNENTAGATTIDSPLFIAQGDADTVVIPTTTAQLVQTYCGLGVNTTEKVYPGVTHDLIGYESAADVAAWMADVLAGQTPAGTCAGS
jgi:pimeloyl-ACP methyl ester carboxylesterase